MLDKAIEHGKEKRKPYRGAKSIDLHCRNHGSCSHCMKNRNYKNMKRLQSALEQERAKLYFETKFCICQAKKQHQNTKPTPTLPAGLLPPLNAWPYAPNTFILPLWLK